MDEKTLKQMIREYELEMPPEIMSMINSFDWKRELRAIVQQEGLMLDIGADLEESTYLLLLGVVKVEDVYERINETHGIEHEKTQKVLYEIEQRIFKPLYAKIAEMDKQEQQVESKGGQTITDAHDDVSRDDILAEIEKEHDVQPTGTNIVMPGTGTIPSASMHTAAATTQDTAEVPKSEEAIQINKVVEQQPVSSDARPDRLGLRADGTAESSPSVPTRPAPVTGIQADPIAAGLAKPVATETPKAQPAPAPVTRASDPYREPIE